MTKQETLQKIKGGVNAWNVAEWFAAGVVAVGAGDELCPPSLAKEGKFEEITGRAAELVAAVNAARAVSEWPERLRRTAGKDYRQFLRN